MERFEALTARALAYPGSPWDKLEVLCATMLAGIRHDPAHVRLSLQARVGTEVVPREVQAVIRESGTRSFRNVATLIQQGQEAGQVAAGDPAELALTFFALVQGLALSVGEVPDAIFPGTETVLRVLRAREEGHQG